MNQEAIKEIANQLGVGANYLAEHLTDFAPQWGMFKAMKAEGDEAFGYDKTFVVATLGIFALVTLVVFGCFAMDAITHLAVPQVAMINDMLEMVQNG